MLSHEVVETEAIKRDALKETVNMAAVAVMDTRAVVSDKQLSPSHAANYAYETRWSGTCSRDLAIKAHLLCRKRYMAKKGYKKYYVVSVEEGRVKKPKYQYIRTEEKMW